ncbi:MAG: InlB B-repeat-containing protein [Promethearchaeota archaeon]
MAGPKVKRSDILLGLVVLVAVIMSIALFLSQLPGFDGNPNGPNPTSLQIIDLAKNAEAETLIIYVENTGSETIALDSGFSVIVNDIEIPMFEGSIDKSNLEQGQIATIDVPFKISSDIPLVVKILVNNLIFAERSVSDPETISSAYNLRVNIQGDSANKVTKNPDQSSYPSGTSVELTGISAEGWIFSEWNGDVAGLDNPISLVVDSDKTVNAIFTEGGGPSPTPSPSPTPTPTPGIEKFDVTFIQSGLDSTATGTILTVLGSSKSYSDFPFTLEVSKDSFLNYDYADLVESSSEGKQFVLDSVSGPNSPISVTRDVTILANFNIQFEVTFSSSPENAQASTQPEGIQWLNSGDTVSINTEMSSFRYVFFQWETSNQDNQIENINSQITNVTINGPGSITAVYSLVQLQVSFRENGIDNPSIGATVSYRIDGGSVVQDTVPFDFQVDFDSNIEYTYDQTLSVSVAERYQLIGTSPSSPVTVTENTVIVGNYAHQYFVIFDENGLDSSADGTVLTIGGEAKIYADFPIIEWFDSGTTYRYSNIVSGGNNKRFILLSPSGPRTITGPGSVTGNYKVQYFFEVISPVGNPTGEGWYDDGDIVSSDSGSPIPPSGSPEVGYVAIGYSGTGSAPSGSEISVVFPIDESSSITWEWEGTVILYPNGDSSPQMLNSSGFSDNWRSVSDYSNPNNANYVYTENPLFLFLRDSTEYVDYYSLENLGTMSGTITSVTVNARCISSGGDTDGRLYLRLDGGVRRRGEFSVRTNWNNYNYSPDRPGGGQWSWTDINNLECGVSLQLNNDQYARSTLVWVEVKFIL